MMILPPNFLDDDVSIRYVHQAPYASTTKAPYLSRHVRAHTYIKHKSGDFGNKRGGDFGTHFILSPRELAS